MSGTVLTVVLGVCAPERSAIVRTLGTQHETASIAEDDENVPIAATAAVLQADVPRLVLECPSTTHPHDVLALGDAHGGPFPPDTTLGAIVTVVDAMHLLEDLADGDGLPAGWDDVPTNRTRGVIAVDQIEHATTLLLVNAAACDSDRLGTVLALLSHLNPRARLTLHQQEHPWGAGIVASVGAGAPQTPGWLHLLNDEHDPFITGYGISAVRYQNLRPFHPERLHDLMNEGLEHRYGQLIRSAGLCRFATRPGVTARWDHTGPAITFELAARDTTHPSVEPLTIGQELALIGQDLDAPALTAALDACALTDEELADGPLVWLTYPDPFPTWNQVVRTHPQP